MADEHAQRRFRASSAIPRDEQGKRRPLDASEAWDQFQGKLLVHGLFKDHNFGKPFVINQKLCQYKIDKVNSVLEESQKVKDLTVKLQESEEQRRFYEMQLKLNSLEEQLTLKDDMIALQKQTIVDLKKRKEDKTLLIMKQRANIKALEKQNELLQLQLHSKVSQVNQPQVTSQYDRPEESSYKRPSDDDSVGSPKFD